MEIECQIENEVVPLAFQLKKYPLDCTGYNYMCKKPSYQANFLETS